MALKFTEAGGGVGSLKVMLPHPNPVVEPLQREVQVVINLQLDHCKPSVSGYAQQIEQAMIAGASDGGHLRVHMPRVEASNDAAFFICGLQRLPSALSRRMCRVGAVSDGVRIHSAVEALARPLRGGVAG